MSKPWNPAELFKPGDLVEVCPDQPLAGRRGFIVNYQGNNLWLVRSEANPGAMRIFHSDHIFLFISHDQLYPT